MAQTPAEILDHVFSIEDSSFQDFKAYSLVCSGWRCPAQRELFGRATIRISRLDKLVSFLTSITFTSLLEDTYICSLISRAVHLRISLGENSPLDPNLADFFRLLNRVENLSLSRQTRYLFQESVFSAIQSSFLHLLNSSALHRVVIHADSFPVELLPACVHVKELYWVDIPPLALSHSTLQVSGFSSHSLQTILLEGSAKNTMQYIRWLHDRSEEVSTSNIKDAAFYFTSDPSFPDEFCSLFKNISTLTLRYDACDNCLPYNGNHPAFARMNNLKTLKVETSLATARRSTDPLEALFRLFHMLRPFIRSPPKKIRVLELEVLGNSPSQSKVHTHLEAVESVLPGSLQNFCNRFPQLTTCSAYAPWFNHDNDARVFADCRASMPNTNFYYGPRDAGFQT